MNYDKCPACYGELEQDGTCSCGYGVKRASLSGVARSTPEINRKCPTCSNPGYLTHATNGSGPWFCREHFA